MKKLLRIVNFIVAKLYLTVAVLLVLFAVVVTLARALTPILSHYKDNFSHLAEEYLHKPVQFGAVSAKWRGFQPVIDLHNVKVLNQPKGKVIFHLNDLQIGLNILQSLWQRQVIVSRFYIDGMHMQIAEDAQLKWFVKGLNQDNKNASPMRFADILTWLLSQPSLVLQNINLQIQPYNENVRTINDLDIVLFNNNDVHQLRGQANLKGHHSPLDVAVDLNGRADKVGQLTGKVYVAGRNTPVSDWLHGKQLFGFSCQQGNFSFQTFADWNKSLLTNIHTKLQLQHVILQSEDQKTVYLNHLSANLFWQEDLVKQSWQLSGDKIDISINHHQWPLTNFIVAEQKAKDDVNFQLKLTDLEINQLYVLMSHLSIVPKAVRQFWMQAHPMGSFHDIEAVWSKKDKQIPDYHFAFKFKDVGLLPYKKIPGFIGVDGKLNADQDAGVLNINSQDSSLNYTQLFSGPMQLQQLNGIVSWQNDPAGTHVESESLEAKTAQLNLDTQLNLYLPKDSKPKISLISQYELKQLGNIMPYFPAKILSPKLLQWFKQAFVKGDNLQGQFLLAGPLQDFPFVKNNGQFLVAADIHNLQFSYVPKWPNIENLSGELVFHKKMMAFTASKGELVGQPIESLNARIPDLHAKPQSYLYIDSLVNFNDMGQGKYFVNHSPLQKTVGHGLAPLTFTGKGELNLKLKIPLHKGETTSDGMITIINNQLSMPNWRLNYSHLNGHIHFDNSSLSSDDLQALFYNRPIKIKISTLKHQGEKVTQFRSHGRIDLRDVKRYFNFKKFDFMKGVTNFTSTVDIYANGLTHINFVSMLQGVSIHLPKPFSKEKNTKHLFQVDAYVEKDIPPIIRLTYKNLIGAVLAYAKKSNQTYVQRAIIHFGRGGYILQAQNGLCISGNLQKFDWDVWQPYFKEWGAGSSVSTKTDPNALSLKQIDLLVQQLKAFHQSLKDVRLSIQKAEQEWIIKVENADINGNLLLPFNYKKNTIKGQFQTLHIQAFEKGKKNSVGDLNPTDLPSINVSAIDFAYGKTHYGQVTLHLQALPDGVKIDKLSIINKNYILNTNGSWRREGKNDISAFAGTLYTDNLGDLLKTQGFSNHIQDGKGTADFSLSWPASPAQFQTVNVEGAIRLDFSDGAVVDLGKDTTNKIGLGKLINILSIQSIARKLTLNFSDLESKGYSFTTLKGDLSITDGNVYSQNLYLNGPVAELYITGEVGLIKHFYDVNLRVNPYIATSLPILAGIAGGPLIGVATWVVSKIARLGIEKAVVYQYHIGGTWKKPVITDLNKKKKQDEKVTTTTAQ